MNNKVLDIIGKIVKSPITSMFLAVIFLYTGIDSIIEDYKSDITDIDIHHSIALYGLVMFIKSILSSLQAIYNFSEAKKKLNVKV